MRVFRVFSLEGRSRGRVLAGISALAINLVTGFCLHAQGQLDVTPPTIEITSPTDLFLNDTTPEIIVAYADDRSGVDLATLVIKLDLIDITRLCTVGESSATCESPELTEESHTITAAIQDRAGNSASTSFIFTVDVTLPDLAISVFGPLIFADGFESGDLSAWSSEPPDNPLFLNDATPHIVVSYSDLLSGVDLTTLVIEIDGLDLLEACTVGTSSAKCKSPELVEGEHTITASVGDLAGNSFDATVTVTIDVTPPTIIAIADPPANPAGWHNAAVDVTFECEDALSGVLNCPKPVTLAEEGADQEVTGTVSDLAGNFATTTLIVNIDLTPPTIAVTVDPPANAAGWHRAPVTVTFECSDALSGVASCPEPVTLSGDGAGQEVTGTVLDVAGNSATATAIVNLDLTPPEITATVDPPANAAGWNNTAVTVTFVCEDALSGVASCPEPLTVSAEGADQEIAGTAFDVAGNSVSASARVSIDLTPPTFDPAEFRPLPCPEVTLDLQAQVRACFADPLSGAVDGTVQLLIDGVDQTGSAVIADGCIAWDSPQSFAAGDHGAEILAADLAGNAGSASWCFAIGSAVLEIAITSPTDGFVTNAATIDVSGTVDPLAESVTVNGVAATLASGTFQALGVPLVEGVGALVAVATTAAGGEGTASVTVTRDSTPPTIAAVVDPPANASGWHDGAVTVSFDCTDALSGVDTCPDPVTVTAEGAGQEVSGTATDVAGNSASTLVTLNLDLTPPAIAAAVTPPANGAGWHNGAVTVSFDCDDALSGLASCSSSVTVSTEGADQTVSGTAVDLAGNSATVDVLVSIDLSPPTFDMAELRPLACPELAMESRPQVRACFADAFAGVDEASVTLTVDGVDRTALATIAGGCVSWDPQVDFGPGEHQSEATATDLAGNGGSVSWCFEVALPPVAITIDSPVANFLTGDDMVDVFGTVEAGVDSVTVNGVAAQVTGPAFTALAVPLREGRNVITAVARVASGNVGTASVVVLRDTTAPRLAIETPRAGAVLTSLQVDVAGLVNDLIAGTTINADDCNVTVNGVEAMVANRSFLVPDLLLKRGPNTLTAIATDRMGNSSTTSIDVTVEDRAGQRIVLLAGNGQSGGIFEELADPLIVALVDVSGDPVIGRPVSFAVSRGAGTLRAFPEEGSEITVLTDELGQASVVFELGERSGAGNNRVLATAPGFLGEVEFCAEATTGLPVRVVANDGDQQRGAVEEPLPEPLVVLVNDAGGNPVGGVDVTFEVFQGGGSFAGSPTVVSTTDLDGLAEALWILGPEAGINNNVVGASFPGLVEAGATFIASAQRVGSPGGTSVSGVVLDNQDNPVPGVTLSIEDTALSAVSDDQGQFSIAGAPVGFIHLVIDGTTTSRPGEWPHLSFELTTTAGRDNTVGRPIYLLPFDMANTAPAASSEDVTLSLANVPGSELTVFGNSVTCPDGTTNCAVSVTQVRGERVPMAPPLGSSFMLAWTIQPAGATFDPPARICIPNADMLPGQQAEIFSFDHDQEAFIAVGTATVAADGSQLCSDPGFGVGKGGWHGCTPPPPPKDCVADCGPCKRCNRDTGSCEPIADGTTCDDKDDCTFDDKCMGGTCNGDQVEVTKVTGDCVAAVGASVMCTVESNRPDKVEWMAPGGMPASGMGATFSTTYSTEGDKVVTAKCDASSKTKDVTVTVDCATIMPVLMEPEVAGGTGGNFGRVRPGSRRVGTYKGCADTSRWCFRLEKYLEEHEFGVSSVGRTDITGAADPNVTPATCAAIITDLTPPGAGATRGPPRRTYWSSAFTTAHERAHVANVKSMVTDIVFADLQTFVRDPSRCTDCKTAVPTAAFDAEMNRLFTTNFRAMAPTEEARAHGVSNPMYTALIGAIRARARAAPASEGWPAGCM